MNTGAVTLNLLSPEVGQTLAGVFRLDGSAFVNAISVRHEWWIAVAIVLLAGFSEALGQSIVLFANRVRPGRFFFSLLVDALLFTFGYAFLVLSTWVVCRIPGTPHIPFTTLALVFALSYTPMLFTFLGALPYLGAGAMRVLRVWHLLAMVVGVAAVGGVDVFAAATSVWLGWIVMLLAQHSFGKPIASLGARLLDAVAGVRLLDDAQIDLGDVAVAGTGRNRTQRVAVTPKGARHPRRWVALVGLGGVAFLALVVALALDPVRQSIFGWQQHLPVVLRLPFDLLWLIVIAVVVSAFMAPLETLGWWAGWFGDAIDTSDDANPPRRVRAGNDAARYVVYLDGIAQSSGKYTPDIETFLDALAPELPPNVRLVRGVMAYSVLNKPLDDDPVFSRFWKFVEASRSRNLNSILGMIINLRNVLIVAVSADPRYGPMYNFGIARVMYASLVANGYRKNSGVPVTLIGYSGGGQMACGAARSLRRAIDAPVDVISLGGVIAGSDPILDLEHLFHLVGDKDMIERIGPVMFASRWSIAVLSYWNRAKRLGSLTEISLGPVGHQVPGGMLDPNATLPDGRTNLRQTLDYIEGILLDRVEAPNHIAIRTSDYERYVASAPQWSIEPPDPSRYRPVAAWFGRLILPPREERFGGVYFQVHGAPQSSAGLVGTTVKLAWARDEVLLDRLRAATRDVYFSPEAAHAGSARGLVVPLRLNHWRMVDPLESLAGAHPNDDLIVKLAGEVTVEGRGDATTLRIVREPVQISGEYYGLVTFLGPSAEVDGGFRVAHFDRTSGAFSGPEETLVMPAASGIERSPFNAQGWYVYGALDARGAFLVQALAPRALLRPRARSLRPGDRGLVVRCAGRFYLGSFAYGMARVVDDPLSGEPRFDVTYYAIAPNDSQGRVCGAVDRSRYLGDREIGLSGVRPAREAVLSFDAPVPSDEAPDTSNGARRAFDDVLDAFALQLEAMAARYRIGDGTGATFTTPAENATQDSNRALFATLQAIDPSVVAANPALPALLKDLRGRLLPFGAVRHDWSENRYDLGGTLEDEPFNNLLSALASWRCLFPRLAFDNVVAAFVHHGASAWIAPSDEFPDRQQKKPG